MERRTDDRAHALSSSGNRLHHGSSGYRNWLGSVSKVTSSRAALSRARLHTAGSAARDSGWRRCIPEFCKRVEEMLMNDTPSRSDTLAIVHEYTASDSLRKHMLSVEAAMRAYAEKFGEDVDRWGLAGLVHDFDYERFPNNAHSPTEEHPAEGVRILRAHGFPEDILEAIMGHANYSAVPRTS